jgi:hypothetical protein
LSAFPCFELPWMLERSTWSPVFFICEDLATVLHSASAPASDSCCTTCPKRPSRLAWGSRLQIYGCSHFLLALRKYVSLDVGQMSGRLHGLGFDFECPLRYCCSSVELMFHQTSGTLPLTHEIEMC